MLSTRDAGAYPFVFQRISEPVGVVVAIPKPPVGLWQAAKQRPCADVVAYCPAVIKRFKGRPLLSLMACSLVFISPLVRSIRRPRPLFSRPNWTPCDGLLIGGVDHYRILFAVLGGQACHNPHENAFLAPTLPPAVQRLVWPVFLGASRQRNPLRLKKIIPLNTRLSSTRGLPWDFGKKGESLATCSSVSQ